MFDIHDNAISNNLLTCVTIEPNQQLQSFTLSGPWLDRERKWNPPPSSSYTHPQPAALTPFIPTSIPTFCPQYLTLTKLSV